MKILCDTEISIVSHS